MQVGDLVKRRNNGDLALVLSIIRESVGSAGRQLEVMRCDCGSIQYVWDYQYEVAK